MTYRLFDAIDIVARRIVADEWDRAPDDLVLDHLDLTDDDARAVVRRAWDLVHRPKPDDVQYKAACEFLARRAEATG